VRSEQTGRKKTRMTKKEMRFLDAALRGHVRILKKLLDGGVDVNVQDTRGTPWNRTALMHAAEKGHLKAVDLLLNAGANVDARDKGIPIDVPGGNTALILAISGPRVDDRPAHVDVAHRLLDAGASPRIKGGGTSVINAAAYAGDAGLFKRLVELGANVEPKDRRGRTPLASAVLNASFKIVRFLLANGADPNSRMPGGTPILVDAALGGSPHHLDICKGLVEAGANPNRGNEDNFTPLMAACRGAELKIVKYLLSLPVRVNEVDREYGRTALDIIHGLQEPPKFAADVIARLKRLGESLGPPRSRLNAIERLLRRTGAKTRAELGTVTNEST
jgi:ankyrin repeat protein